MNEYFSLQSSLEANYLIIKLNEPVQLDEIAIKVTKEDCPKFMIPFKTVDINGSVSLKYKLVNTIALEYADMNFSKAEFVDLYTNLLSPFIKGKDWFLDYHNFCIDPRYIFLSKKDSAVLYIYVPEKSYQNSDEDIFLFFKKVFDRTIIKDDANFQVNLYKFFARQGVTLSDLYSFFQEESHYIANSTERVPYLDSAQSIPVQVVDTQTSSQATSVQQSTAQSDLSKQAVIKSEPPKSNALEVTEKKSIFKSLFSGGSSENNKVDKKSVLMTEKPSYEAPVLSGDGDEIMDALFGDNKKKFERENRGGGFLFGKKREAVEKQSVVVQSNSVVKQPKMPKLDVAQTQPTSVSLTQPSSDITEPPDSDKTEIFSDDYLAVACLDLIESPIPGAIPKIILNFKGQYITIGRISSDENQPDVAFSKDFSRIGRRHARIEKRDGRYYVIDLGSANHTLLNGKILVPNQPYELSDGGELTFTESKPVRYRIRL